MKSKVLKIILTLLGLSILLLSTLPVSAAPRLQQDINPEPPLNPVKLIFIHHSTGENWLTDGYGDLGRALAENNYFVSDTNYGWGPDSIGDRTDIPNWTEWFSSDQAPVITEALFNESGQNADYTRLFDDPGGENSIIMFKSCFPNSALEGNPDDPADPDGWLSVGHAKYVYNTILEYFATRPDKLFIVITAPPLSDPTYADNARAFNQWLYNDWLDENDYSLPNVAVFDFYNLLTDHDAHHRYIDGYIEHSYSTSNTLAYPSGDDHPSESGSRKATEEFVPLINIFYNRWAASSGAPEQALEPTQNTAPDQGESGVPLPPEDVLTIDDFESGESGWVAAWDASTSTTFSCATEQGTGSLGSTSLRLNFSIAPNSWSTCTLIFDPQQDWSTGEWITFEAHPEQLDLQLNVILFGGPAETPETYVQTTHLYRYDGSTFIPYAIPWNEFLRVAWETDGGTPFQHPEKITGLGFGIDGLPDGPYSGTVWIDNIHLEKSPSYENTEPQRKLPCLGSIILPVLFVCLAWLIRRRS